jgi:hypothetical protein
MPEAQCLKHDPHQDVIGAATVVLARWRVWPYLEHDRPANGGNAE